MAQFEEMQQGLFNALGMIWAFPKLEFLDLSISFNVEPDQFYGEMSVWRKALVEISSLLEKRVPVLRDILKTITKVSTGAKLENLNREN